MQLVKKYLMVTGTIGLLAGSVISSAWAEKATSKDNIQSSTKGHMMEDDEEIRAVQTVKVSLQDAIQNALKEVPGKALEAEFEDDKNRYVYEVKIVQQDGRVTKVIVDAENGQVVKAK